PRDTEGESHMAKLLLLAPDGREITPNSPLRFTRSMFAEPNARVSKDQQVELGVSPAGEPYVHELGSVNGTLVHGVLIGTETVSKRIVVEKGRHQTQGVPGGTAPEVKTETRFIPKIRWLEDLGKVFVRMGGRGPQLGFDFQRRDPTPQEVANGI